jgi:carbamoyl-phosphate synthase small subunit
VKKALLVLEDGRCFEGQAWGTPREAIGEVIFNTGVVGYQEMITDPANAGKILVLTYPLIGNYGTASKFNESAQCWLAGLVIKEKSNIYSNWQAEASFDKFIQKQHLPVIGDTDTRTLAIHLREKGQMLGIISTTNSTPKELVSKVKDFKKQYTPDYLGKISVKKIVCLKKKKAMKVAVLDLGIKKSILKQLEALGLSIYIFPYNTRPKEILKIKPKGLVISSGPEEDIGLKEVADNIKNLIGSIPILGISTGMQVLALSLGAKIQKMKLGHRGFNYPVYTPGSYKAEITVQNHSYTINTDSLNKIKEIKITGYNLNDRSVEEIESKKLKIIGVQYDPLSPGLDEVNNVFKKFLKYFKGVK